MKSQATSNSKNLVVILSLLLLVFSLNENSSAQKVRLRSQITPTCATSSTAKFADISADGKIVVQGSYNCRGVFIYDVSNPDSPRLASWYNPGSNLQFLEAIVIGSRGYFGSGNGGGVHIVDLTNVNNPQLLGIVNQANGNAFNSIHEMVVFGNYLIENFNGFSSKILKVINISNPANPVFVRDINPTEVTWVHAMHIRGNRMFTSGWGNSTVRGRTEIYDISNIGTQAPTLLGFIQDATSVTAGNSMHSSWSSEDGNYLYSCRETNNGDADLRTYNISNPAQPLLVNRQSMGDLGLDAVSPHNPVVMGNYLYVSWYQAGLQVFDLTNPATPRRVGQFDTYPTLFERIETPASIIDEPWDVVCGANSLQNNLPTNYDGNWAVYPFLGQDKVLLGDLKNGLFVVDATGLNAARQNDVSDYDGDGKTDFSTFNSTTGLWKTETSSNNGLNAIYFGTSNDKNVAGDYDGDGKSDIAVFRPADGAWYILGSTSGFRAQQFGVSGDVPVAADYDSDGKTDIAVWRPSTGSWYIEQSTLGFRAQQFGISSDKVLTGDFDNDGKSDLIAWRPSSGIWYVLQSTSDTLLARQFGTSADKPLAGDFDGDGKSDFAIYRPSEGIWYVMSSANNSLTVNRFGNSTDVPIPADYDGDGKADIAVFRPSDKAWYQLSSASGAFNAKVFGVTGDVPSPLSVQPQ